MDWPHSPLHRLTESGAYMVTASTYGRALHFRGKDRLNGLRDALFRWALKSGWDLQAWAVLPNHYHLVAVLERPEGLGDCLRQLHSETARWVNAEDRTLGRQVWFQFWETHLTFERSYLARLNYVHHNPVHHGLVRDAHRYPWCSAAWFERRADEAFRRTVSGFKTDRLRIPECDCTVYE